ncbi:MAG: peptidoglycan bridge formation glycyltransferase FemA/FemB family protein [Candidatus Magasanikbacteria bacterium]|nr:peptidoglycan bridge formation glycyltransferase FemA/FemB family protein [Candidatus Magasanikbacteria bacterium]
MAKIFEGTDAEWDALILKRDYFGSVLQSSVWRRVQQARGNKCVRIIDSAENPSLWVALPIARLFWVWYCPKGPGVLPEASEWKSIVGLLQREKHATILRIEPSEKISTSQGGLLFIQRRDISPTHTLITNIARNEESLFASFHEKTRYNIRVAGKHEVDVDKISGQELFARADEILALYEQTGDRHGIAATPRKDLRALFEVCDVWVARAGEKIIATSLHLGFGKTYIYLHGASDYESRAMMAPYALHWAALKDAQQKKFETYDWWGIAPTNEPAHRLAGVTRFKLGFGGDVFEAPGTFDAGIDRARFGLYTALRRIMRS